LHFTCHQPPLEGTLGPWGQLTEALADTLAEMQDPGGSAVVTPRRLLSLISQRAPHLGQGDQQDSQELLRHLMEGVRTEELRVGRIIILLYKDGPVK
jgi:ubiquitin carboxyl-terminal hydrolase 16/45